MASGPMLLEYSVPRGERRWGPVLFRARRRTVVLAVLVLATVVWLVRRHEPWRWVAELPCDQLESSRRGQRALNATFTPDGLLLFDATGGARLYDVASGHPLRTVLPAVDPERFHYFAFEESRHVLALPNPQYKRGGVATAALYDWTGEPITEFPRLGEEDQRVVVSRTSPTVVYEDHLEPTTRLMVRELTVPRPSVPLIERPDSRYAMAFANVVFSPSGERALIIYWTPEQFLADVVDVKSRKRIGRLFEASGHDQAYEGGFGGSDYVWVGLTDLRKTPTYHVAPVGGEWHRRITGSAPGFPINETILSYDGELLATTNTGRGSLDVRETRTGNLIASWKTQSTHLSIFFPRSHRILLGDVATRRHFVVDPSHSKPLAVLNSKTSVAFRLPPGISPDGDSIVIAASASAVALYHRTGWDCPESHLGALAFPHVWLLCVFFTSAVVSAARDARRARVDSPVPPPEWLPYGMVLLAVPVTLYFIIAAALGRWTVNPAPVVLLTGVGLVTHSRYWRVVTLVVLSVTLGWCIYLLNTLRHAGVKQSSLYPLLDREYVIPHVVPAVALGLAIALCGIALYSVARRSRVPALAAPAS